MPSRTDVANMALAAAGAKPPIVTMTEDSDNARVVNRFYDAVLDAVLRGHPWNCAIHRKTITALADTPDSDYDNQFQLPANPWCLRILQVGEITDQPVEWRVEGRRILCNESSIPIVYIKRITDTNEFDALLLDAFVLKLARKIVMPLTQDAKIAEWLTKEIEEISLPEARSIDAQESSVRQINTSTWNDSRY